MIVYFGLFFLLPVIAADAVTSRFRSLSGMMKDIALDKFVASEFDYDLFLQRVDHNAEKMVPFQDSSNDTYFKVGVIDRRSLDNYTKNEFVREMSDLRKKPWIPVKRIKEELTNCIHMKYGSVSENDFTYDKGVYGWMNVMKFSCALVGEHFYAFGMAFARTRFRLKQIYLKRQNHHLWSMSGRSLITRDVQKIVDVFSRRFANTAQKRFDSELRKISESVPDFDGNAFIKLSDRIRNRISQLYPKKFNHTSMERSKVHQFNSMTVNVKSRVMLIKPTEVSSVVENFSKDLSDEACEILDDCRKEFCKRNDTVEYDYNGKVALHSFFKERAGIARLNPQESLMIYTIAKPTFKFEIVKRATAKGIVDHSQKYDHAADQIFKEMLNQQFSHEFHMHHGTMLDE
ncbi:unnamed protein product, partial [Mesorhabditis belari]|uniref:Uncharacterized protein n=1 Tax=Mesorhabditis belari TaxID=2138241 RepID=A0AAF3ETA7_9BILA